MRHSRAHALVMPRDYSHVPEESIDAIASSLGCGALGKGVSSALASDVEYRLRQVFQDAIKCMRHSKRTTLSAEVRLTATSPRERCERARVFIARRRLCATPRISARSSLRKGVTIVIFARATGCEFGPTTPRVRTVVRFRRGRE